MWPSNKEKAVVDISCKQYLLVLMYDYLSFDEQRVVFFIVLVWLCIFKRCGTRIWRSFQMRQSKGNQFQAIAKKKNHSQLILLSFSLKDIFLLCRGVPCACTAVSCLQAAWKKCTMWQGCIFIFIGWGFWLLLTPSPHCIVKWAIIHGLYTCLS